VVNIPKKKKGKAVDSINEEQFTGKVIAIILPKAYASEINPSDEPISNGKFKPRRTIVGTLMQMPHNNNNRYLFVPNSRCLPRFITPSGTRGKMMELHEDGSKDVSQQLCCVEYVYGSWSNTDKWPPCINLKIMGQSCNVEDETEALLMDNGVNHGEFSPDVLKDVEKEVESGRSSSKQQDGDLGWEPTKEMLKGRRDYRDERIFTIDPTTAKDLDDALHIKPLPDGRVEIGVHIADVSHFVKLDSHVDAEAERRSTTVYLVDRTVPMLPRPLCEIACSLNENVERLAFRYDYYIPSHLFLICQMSNYRWLISF
jgi:exoribonuclease R